VEVGEGLEMLECTGSKKDPPVYIQRRLSLIDSYRETPLYVLNIIDATNERIQLTTRICIQATATATNSVGRLKNTACDLNASHELPIPTSLAPSVRMSEFAVNSPV